MGRSIASTPWVAVGVLVCLVQNAICVAGSSPGERFVLTKDDGQPVCGAFLKALRAANLPPNSPICDIPIDGSVSGFTPLEHALIPEAEAEPLFLRVYGFTAFQKQLTESTREMPSSTIRDWYGTSIFGWKYPGVNLNNDGVKQDVLLWQGYGADPNFLVVKCGEPVMVHTQQYLYQPARLAFVLSPDGQSIDEAATNSIFRMKKGNGKIRISRDPFSYQEVGGFIGIFQFDSLYYTYAFYQWSGDFRGSRRLDPATAQTIGVLRRQNGTTIEDCEIRDREHHW
jgi:hypothetical protein